MVRYVNDFIVGVTEPRDFAFKITIEIESFIKNDFHFLVHDAILTSRDEGGGLLNF